MYPQFTNFDKHNSSLKKEPKWICQFSQFSCITQYIKDYKSQVGICFFRKVNPNLILNLLYAKWLCSIEFHEWQILTHLWFPMMPSRRFEMSSNFYLRGLRKDCSNLISTNILFSLFWEKYCFYKKRGKGWAVFM